MHLRPFLPSDHHEVAAFTASANWGDELVKIIFPRRNEFPADLRRFFVHGLKARMCVPGAITLVAETDPGDVGPNGDGIDQRGGKVVGRMTVQRNGCGLIADRWRTVHPGNWIEGKLLAIDGWYVDTFGLNKAIDVAANRRHFAQLASLEYQPLREERFKECWVVVNLVVDDRYHRRGVGKMLMKQVMKQAQDECVPVGLRSSKTGRKLYESLGFENLGDIEWEDCGEKAMQSWMAWYPSPSEN